MNQVKNIISRYENTRNIIILLTRIILGIIFIYASFEKIIDPKSFSDSITRFHVSPIQLNNLAALIIPWVEFIIGVTLLLGIFIDGSSTLAIVLLLWFIFILSQAVIRGINIECGCFSLGDSTDNSNLKLEMIKRIIQDIIFLFMAFVVKFRKNKFDWRKIS